MTDTKETPEGQGRQRPPQGGEHGEEALALRWGDLVPPFGPCRTEDGLEVTVLEVGIPSRAPGPDRREALVAWGGGGLQWGDIELHRRDDDWFAHGHHRDPRYNGVILHVVLRARTTRTPLANGGSVPLLVLDETGPRVLPERRSESKRCPFLPRFLTAAELGAVLEAAGDARFHCKVEGFRQKLTNAAPDEVLYRALLEGLGYSANREPFRLLAEGLSWGVLEPALKAVPPPGREPLAKALLLGSAGLLRQQVALSGLEETGEGLWTLWHQANLPAVLDRGTWEVLGLRPANHPIRRLAGAAVLLARWAEAGPSVTLFKPLRDDAQPVSRALQGLLSVPGPRAAPPALIGVGRASELVVNAVLPFAAAWAEEWGGRRLLQRAWEAFREHPPLPENTVLCFMARRLWDGGKPPILLRARHQQGLHELYRRCCGSGEPWHCPFTTGVGHWSVGPGRGRGAGPDASGKPRRRRS